jgi:hypothetical protein
MQTDSFNVGVIKPVECMKQGWAMIKDQYWLFFGIAIVGILIAGLFPLLLLGPMMCGIYQCLLQRHDGGKIEFSDLFKGFDYFIPSLVLTLIIAGIGMAAGLLIFTPTFVFMFAAMDSRGRLDPDYGIPFIIFMSVMAFIFGFVLACAHALVIFAHLLIVDRKLDGWSALKLSAKASWQNLNGVIGFILVQMGLGILSYLLCFVGAYFFLPIAYAGTTVMYRSIFSQMTIPPDINVPPSPANYPGAGFSQ